jgi:hypothetical protein
MSFPLWLDVLREIAAMGLERCLFPMGVNIPEILKAVE